MEKTQSFPKLVLFDLLTALLDSWTVWNTAAGSEAQGRVWRAEYLRLTYGCGAYVPYEELVAAAARRVGLDAAPAERPAFLGYIYGPQDPEPIPADAPPLFDAIALDDSLYSK